MYLTWTGSDVLFVSKRFVPSKLSKYPYMFALEYFAKLADLFVQKHVVVSEHLIPELKHMGFKKPFEVRPNPYNETVYYKRKHSIFTVLYYRPKTNNQKFTDWVYGYDLIKMAKENIFHNKDLFWRTQWIEVDGTQNMANVYPLVDIMVRPNRHDGCPRMTRECAINDIPYFHTYKDPDLTKLIDFIYEHYKKYSTLRANETL